ncbi:unnamed protein product [Penicillium salamii]|nr:unnamed protein product [Penicillium salamii]
MEASITPNPSTIVRLPTHESTSAGLDRCWTLNDGYSYCPAEKNQLPKQENSPEQEFIVDWDENDKSNPRNLGLARRWVIVILVSAGSLCVTCTSSIYTTTYVQILPEFHISQIVATLGLSFFIWGLGMVNQKPCRLSSTCVLSSLTSFDRSWSSYLGTPLRVAQNAETLIIGRFFSGLAGSAFLSVAGGTVGDLFARHELAAPMMVYTASPFIGPELGPLIGGFINQFTSWRWSFYVLMIWTGVLLIAIIVFVPETFHPILLKRKAQQIRLDTGDERWKSQMETKTQTFLATITKSIYRPILLLTLEPMCLNLCIFSAILLGILYLFFGAFQLIFDQVYGFTLWQRGCSFLGLLVGMVIAILTDPFWRWNYTRLERASAAVSEPVKYQPEWRLPPAIVGAPLVTIGLFIFAWTVYPNVHWIGAIIGSGIFGAGTILVYSGIFTFLVDAYPEYAASALAANSFARSTFGGVFPLFGTQMYHRLGYHWATTLLALLTLVMAPFPFIFFKYGPRIRQGSKFAATL